MSDEVTALLQRHDDPIHGECPANFDYKSARIRARGFLAAVERRLATDNTPELNTQIEDASFHSELSFPGCYGYLRFSSFGNMIAFTPDHEVAPHVVAAIKDLAPGHGYTFVPTELLEATYTGDHPGVTGIATWWIRYFDYL